MMNKKVTFWGLGIEKSSDTVVMKHDTVGDATKQEAIAEEK